jgi:signal transduction histidine kinase
MEASTFFRRFMSSAVTTVSASEAPLADALRSFPLFEDLTEEQMEWFVNHASDQSYELGTLVVREGQEADSMTIVVEGELRYQSAPPESTVFIARRGTTTGLLPFSRLKKYIGSGYALTRLRVAILHRDLFGEMLSRIPQLSQRLVAVMSDRIRERTRAEEQREKLKALGKLAAGLAHELNNPASAAQRASYDLQEWVRILRESNQTLAECGFDASQYKCLLEMERDVLNDATSQHDALESVERSDQEESFSAWLRRAGVSRGWELSAVFVEGGISTERLTSITDCFIPAAKDAVTKRIAASVAIDQLTRGIQSSTERITELIRAVKGYSFVDQATEQEVDIESGIENTLSILSHRLHHGISVEREYGDCLPRVMANGSELNQVWTNLIDNALDAMEDGGTLRIKTACEPGMGLVEIADNGKGIPREIQDRIFDPFFTTKDVGAGRGLGLDIVFRILQKHRGDIRFSSQPGETVFQVRLPIHGGVAF